MEVTIVSWNINGIRAAVKKGLWQRMREIGADIFCFQETKARAEQVPHSLDLPTEYFSYYNSAEKAGYSGVATFTTLKPKEIVNGMRLPRSDDRPRNDNENAFEKDNEGRILVTKYAEFNLLNVYFPNGGRSKERLFYKMEFYEYFLKYINKLRDNGEKVIFCGDVNTAHKEIDLARPKENVKVSGFLPEEREWMDKLAKNGWVDTFRLKNPEDVRYTWWDLKSGARGRNVGWRIDYFFVDEAIIDKVKGAFILNEVLGSDHCPVGIKLEI